MWKCVPMGICLNGWKSFVCLMHLRSTGCSSNGWGYSSRKIFRHVNGCYHSKIFICMNSRGFQFRKIFDWQRLSMDMEKGFDQILATITLFFTEPLLAYTSKVLLCRCQEVCHFFQLCQVISNLGTIRPQNTHLGVCSQSFPSSAVFWGY